MSEQAEVGNMVPVQAGDLLCYQFPLFSSERVSHAVFSRRGGFSPPPWSSLNFGNRVGDTVENVARNHAAAFEVLGRPEQTRFDVNQVHSSDYVIAEAGIEYTTRPSCDIAITNDPRVTLIMRFADCVPILLYDVEHHAIGLVHAGWRGTVKKAAQKAVTAMQTHFSSRPEHLLVGIGPCICMRHYEVGGEVLQFVEDLFGKTTTFHTWDGKHRGHLDLGAANEALLREAGVDHVALSGMCTACDLETWYSHRAERGNTGRFAVMLGLKDL